MKLDLSKTDNAGNHSTLVLFATITKKDKEETVKLSDAQLQKQLSASIEDKTITGKAQETLLFRNLNFNGHQNVLIAGLGQEFDHEIVRQLAANIYGSLKGNNVNEACIQVDALAGKKDFPLFLQAFVEGLLLADYSFDQLKSKKKEDKKFQVTLVSKLAGEASVKKAFQEGEILSESVNFSRWLGDMPGNLMTPSILAQSAVNKIKGLGIRAEIWDKARIKKEKMGGLYGVAQGSDQEPRFIILRYNGAPKNKKPLLFVGKGLTFDAGGISIKPSAAMEEMKYDMCGGANVIGALIAIAKLKLKVNVMAVVPSTENLLGGSATKPGDVHTARNGKTFEVNNTDAEGRLILSDALSYASEQKPEMIIDAATLTGAIVVALGNTHTGYFTKNEALNKKIRAAAQKSGELVWQLPLTEFHTKDMKGTYADLSNISSGKGAGSATAAAFLEQFVGEGIPWAHFDIAGTAWATGSRFPYNPKKHASGVMIRTFVELAKSYQ
jgi:leucyl aminopeptidase